MDEFARAVEATIFASSEPLTVEEIQAHAGEGDVAAALEELAQIYTGRGIELVERGGRWHFQTAPDLAHLLRRTREEPRRLSRAATETLAIVSPETAMVNRPDVLSTKGVVIFCMSAPARAKQPSGMAKVCHAPFGAFFTAFVTGTKAPSMPIWTGAVGPSWTR